MRARCASHVQVEFNMLFLLLSWSVSSHSQYNDVHESESERNTNSKHYSGDLHPDTTYVQILHFFDVVEVDTSCIRIRK